MRRAESSGGASRHEMAPETVFVSHETYTPARGAAPRRRYALRRVFGADADRIVIANAKGSPGAMGVGIEDVVAFKSLQTGIMPPVPNFEKWIPSSECSTSPRAAATVRCALRLAAGFGSRSA